MEPGKFYVYYKPSFINGFEQYIEKDINFNFLQAFEGVCRDEFSPNPAYISSEEFRTLLGASRGLQTERFAADIFDQCFSRTFNVEFAFNPNFKEFRRKFKHGGQRPLLFVYSPPLYMSRYIGEFKEVLKNYTEVFDIYYTGDEKEASQLFYTKEFPEIFPYVVIVDPKKRKALKAVTAGQVAAALEGKGGDGLNEQNSYPHKYREIIFFNKISKDLSSLIDKFLDGEVHHFY
jgi:hypothetical protein